MSPSLRLVEDDAPQPWVGPPPKWKCVTCGKVLRPSTDSPWGWVEDTNHLCEPRRWPAIPPRAIGAALVLAAITIMIGALVWAVVSPW